MFVNHPHPVDHYEAVHPTDLGGNVLDGDPPVPARRPGTVTTVVDGEVTIADATGTRRTYRPDRSHVIEQDVVVRWEVQRGRVYAPTLDGWTA